jgi:hypothetical protein
MTRIPVIPELLTRARERAGLDALALAGRFSKVSKWETEYLQPALWQMENSAHAVHMAVGYPLLPAVLEHFGVLADGVYERFDGTVVKSRIFSQLHDTLLPKLISGALRVQDAEKFLEKKRETPCH